MAKRGIVIGLVLLGCSALALAGGCGKDDKNKNEDKPAGDTAKKKGTSGETGAGDEAAKPKEVGAELASLEGKEATGIAERLELYTTGLRAIMAKKQAHITFGCKENEDLLVQYAWDGSAFTAEVGPKGPKEMAATLEERGYSKPGVAGPNWSLRNPRVKDPERFGMATEELFTGVLGCPHDYTGRVDAAGE